ncbi:MAG: hypothetical protein HKN27_15305 [Silicimonas sp.]|nr:hypothetical protein [Silicimonas sp.]
MMQNVAPNEGQELKNVAILLSRGVGLAALAGVLWSLPEISRILWIAAALGIFPVVFAISVVAVAAAGARNILCRILNLVEHPRIGFCIGAMLLAGLLAVLVEAFFFGEALAGRFFVVESNAN